MAPPLGFAGLGEGVESQEVRGKMRAEQRGQSDFGQAHAPEDAGCLAGEWPEVVDQSAQGIFGRRSIGMGSDGIELGNYRIECGCQGETVVVAKMVRMSRGLAV